MAESTQDKLDRVRRPRVQIKYKVETGGAMEVKQLPFLVGVMGDFTGDPDPEVEQKALKERRFVQIDRDNFNDVMKTIAPRLQFAVDDKLTGDADKQMKVLLKFANMDDFSPEKVAEQIPDLRDLLRTRAKLNELLNRISVNEKLGDLLQQVLEKTDTRDALLQGLEQAKAKPTDSDAKE